MNRFSDVHYAILRLLAECGWVSQSMLELTDYSYTYRTRSLKMLLDQQYIRKQGKGKEKAYALAPKGRNHLAGFNARRFRDEVMALTQQMARHPERAVLRGDVAAMMSFAGFAVHVDDKPALPAYTPSHNDWRCLVQNVQPFSYPGETDGGIYMRRLSPTGCYYDATVVKELAAGSGWDAAGLGYSRACGVLVTPSYLFRVYHSRDVAMKVQVTGERNFHNFLSTDFIFKGYRPCENNAVIILGTDFTAAIHILGSSGVQAPIYVKDGSRRGYQAVKGAKGELITPSSLGKPAFYLPLQRESLMLLRLMQYPFWKEMLIREINREVFGLDNQERWSFELEGSSVYVLVPLALSQLSLSLQVIRTAVNKKVWIICLDWQEPLFRELLRPFACEREIRLTRLPSAYMEDLNHRFKEYWEG